MNQTEWRRLVLVGLLGLALGALSMAAIGRRHSPGSPHDWIHRALVDGYVASQGQP